MKIQILKHLWFKHSSKFNLEELSDTLNLSKLRLTHSLTDTGASSGGLMHTKAFLTIFSSKFAKCQLTSQLRFFFPHSFSLLLIAYYEAQTRTKPPRGLWKKLLLFHFADVTKRRWTVNWSCLLDYKFARFTRTSTSSKVAGLPKDILLVNTPNEMFRCAW